MIVSKLASACFNDIQGGLAGYEATINMSLEQLEDEVVETRLMIIKKYSLQNALPLKDLMFSLNCIELDCKSLDKCCAEKDDFSAPVAHFEIPQIVNDFGEEAIMFIGSTDKSVKFKVYTSPVAFKYQKYKMHRSKKPYVYIDTTPNENNFYDGWVFNAPLLERISITAIFKDPRQVEQFACCGFTEADNLSFLAQEVKQTVIKNKLQYYRSLYPQPSPNNQVPQ